MQIRSALPHDVPGALGAWRAANVARGQPRWTGADNQPARRVYERAGMNATDLRRIADGRCWVRYERRL